jgi:hypothetical protein
VVEIALQSRTQQPVNVRGVVSVQQWAEIRRLVLVVGRSQREVARQMGLAHSV